MTMLPITHENPEFDSMLVAVYCVGAEQISRETNELFALENLTHLPSALLAGDLQENISAVLVPEHLADLDFLEKFDAVIFLIDAALGVSPKAIQLWQSVAEIEIPLLILATNLFATHTDFDEVVAITNRVFADDLLIRFLPMADDEETEVVGQFDLLRNLILDYSSGVEILTNPDPEHLELTAEQRETLVERLAYQGLSDGLLEMYQSGINPTNEQLLSCWAAQPQKTLIALDRLAGRVQLKNWLSAVQYRWVPYPESDDHDTHIQFPSFYGYGVKPGLARFWGSVPSDIELTTPDGQSEVLQDTEALASGLVSSCIDVGDVLHLPGKPVELSIPVFD